MYVLGRDTGSDDGTGSAGTNGEIGDERLPTVQLGSFLARDGSAGAAVGIDADSPHAGVVFGKRGTGKSYTLGVLAEGLAAASGVAPVVVDPMGVFDGLRATGGQVVEPRVRPAAIPPEAWPDLLGLDPASGPGSLVWRVVADALKSPEAGGSGESDESPSLATLRDRVDAADAPAADRRAAANHLRLAESWGVFDADAPPTVRLVGGGEPTVLDLAGVPEAAAAAVVRAVARGLYDARIDGDLDRLPWLLVDEAHAFFGGVADPALRTLLTRGRAPGVSLVCATQRPGALRASPSRSRTCSSPTGSPPSATSTGSPRRRRPTSPATSLPGSRLKPARRSSSTTRRRRLTQFGSESDGLHTVAEVPAQAGPPPRSPKTQDNRLRRSDMERTPLGFFLVALGGFVGAVARHGIDIAVGDATGAATLLVNVLGSFALGVLVTRAARHRTRLFVGTGMLSSFTTYSTFVGNAVTLGTTAGAAYVAVSYAAGFAAAAAGLFVGGRV